MPRATVGPDSVALIVRATMQLARRLRAERPQGSVSLSALSVLAALHRLGPLTGVALAEAEHLKPQSLTRLLSALQSQGWIARHRPVQDRRERIIELTPAGRGVLSRDIAARRAWLAATMTELLEPPEQRQLTDAATLMLRLALAR